MIELAGIWDLGFALHTYNSADGGRTLLGEAIYRYQYRKQWYLVDSLARWAQAASSGIGLFSAIDLLIPVPGNRAGSDYDPTTLLVDWLSQLTTVPRAVGILNRQGLISEYGDTGPEPSRGGMNVVAPEAVKGKDVLLVDGIICSGTTLQVATQALRTCGVNRVNVLVFAKIERQSLDSFGMSQRNV